MFALKPSAQLSANEIAAAALADQGGRFNPQQQYPVRLARRAGRGARLYGPAPRVAGLLDRRSTRGSGAALARAQVPLDARAKADRWRANCAALADAVKAGPERGERRDALA